MTKPNFKVLQKIYQSVKIPKELPYEVNKAIKKTKKKRLSFATRTTIKVCTTLVTCFIIFMVMVNVNPNFVAAVENIPVLSHLVKWLQIREIHEKTEVDVIDAQIPNLINTGNTDLEKTINQKINEKIQELIEIARNDAYEFKEMLESYDPNYKFEPIHLNIFYEIKSTKNGILSFIITQEQTDNMHANVHVQKLMYNIDINHNKELSLQDLLGENYEQIINTQIKEKIAQIEENGTGDFFEPQDFPYLEHGGWFEGITENQKFYINENGNVVIVFDKYEIAPGYMGMPEFEIQSTD